MKAQLTPEEEQSPAHIFIFMSLKGKKENSQAWWNLLVKKPQLLVWVSEKGKAKLIPNNPQDINSEIKISSLEKVSWFQHINEGSNPGILERLVHSRNSKT